MFTCRGATYIEPDRCRLPSVSILLCYCADILQPGLGGEGGGVNSHHSPLLFKFLLNGTVLTKQGYISGLRSDAPKRGRTEGSWRQQQRRIFFLAGDICVHSYLTMKEPVTRYSPVGAVLLTCPGVGKQGRGKEGGVGWDVVPQRGGGTIIDTQYAFSWPAYCIRQTETQNCH